MAKLFYVVDAIINVVNNVKDKVWPLRLCVMQNIYNSCEILLLILCKMPSDCTNMAFTNDRSLFLAIPIT